MYKVQCIKYSVPDTMYKIGISQRRKYIVHFTSDILQIFEIRFHILVSAAA